MNTYNIDKMYENYSSEVERMQKCIDELQQENQKYKEVIDKAIEFIKSSQCKYDGWEIAIQLYENEIKQLLNILKEVSE